MIASSRLKELYPGAHFCCPDTGSPSDPAADQTACSFFFAAAVNFLLSLKRFSCEFVVAERSTGLPVNLSLPSVPFGIPVNFSLPAVWFQALLVFAALHPWDQVFDLLSSCRPWLRQQWLVHWGVQDRNTTFSLVQRHRDLAGIFKHYASY